MQLVVNRQPSRATCTHGDLFIDGQFQCHTLEDVVRERPGVPVSQWKIAGITAIPTGTYRITVDFSNRFQRMLIHILEVPGFEGVRIHSGNTDKDTEGCILLGMTRTANSVLDSKTAVAKVQKMVEAALAAGQPVTIQVAAAFAVPAAGPVT